ncbi:MAG: ABC-F family ATP-binding cassette domain-containing protein [Bacteroidetes bacterium]|nr:ABC-F family ATP-binding cassette domain-containing protein [Bacteroidota bacterium]MCL2301957.1 ABC-F family ATP-binding cassette domain-containing protein [Lentimicrobiaceae bacterium]
MNYLTIEKLTKSFGEKLLFEDITFGIERGQKTALIAKNGTGKSSLLNIISGLDSPDSGKVTLRNGITISYLPQLETITENYSVMDVIFDSNSPIIKVVKEYEAALTLVKRNETSENLARFEHALSEMERLHAWDLESRVKEILSRFGIDDIFKNVSELSGGQRKKTALAKTLIADTDLLILDEPTNHLDIDMIEWLEEYLSTSNTTLLMVTHDRYFLDKVCNNIIELDNHKLYQYKGKYDYYLEKKAERIANESAELEKIKQLYHKELEWVRTSPSARTTKAKARINSFEDLKENANRKAEKQADAFHVRTERLGNKILEINNLDFSYPDKMILDDFSYIFKKGEKCGIVGKNGTGKSTLLKLLVGEILPNAGKIIPGQTIQFGYFAQDGLPVKGNKRVIDIVKEHAEVVRLENGNYVGASQFLNYFGFKYEQQYTYYEDLSGGEKRKLSLLITLLKNPNFLILDEPTNDFDIDTLNLLEDFLTHYQGCILVVSHDRWFMNKLVDHLFVFEGNGKVKDFYGNYTEYRIEKQKEESRRQKTESGRQKEEREKFLLLSEEKVADGGLPTADGRGEKKLTWKERKELDQLEIEIPTLEAEKDALLQKMNSGNGTPQELQKWGASYQNVSEEIDSKTMRWLELSEKK